MCQFYSSIVTRKLRILDDVENGDSHEDIIQKYKLKDDKLKDRDFVRLEIIPKDGDIFNHNPNNWKYKVDEEGTLPRWYLIQKDKIEEMAFNKLFKVFKTQFLIGGEYNIINKNIRFVKDVKIKVLRGKIDKIWGSSQVGEMWGNSRVGEMYSNSQVDKMYDSSHVGKIWGSSRVGEMYSNSQVDKMYDSSQVGEMWGNSRVGEMYDSSHVGEMLGNSQIGKMFNSSQVGEMLDNTTVNVWSENVKVKQSGGRSVVIKRYLKNVKVIIK